MTRPFSATKFAALVATSGGVLKANLCQTLATCQMFNAEGTKVVRIERIAKGLSNISYNQRLEK